MNNLDKHEKQDKIKWIVTFIALGLLFVMITSVIIGMFVKTKDRKESSQAVAFDENGMELNSEQVYNMPSAIMFSAQALALAEDGRVNVNITASIEPINATNQQVDYSVAWGEAPEHGNDPVTDYVNVSQVEDGSKQARVSCYKDFGDDVIVITVTTRDGGFTDTCLVYFKGIACQLRVNHDSMQMENFPYRPASYVLGTNKTYEFDIDLQNFFGTEVKKKDLKVTLSATGSLYFGTCETDPSSGISTFRDIELRNLNDMKSAFIKSVDITGNTLRIGTASTTVENFYSIMESDEFGTYILTHDRYVFEDILDMNGGTGYLEAWQYNVQNIDKCYFTINVKDNISGCACNVNVWLSTSVQGVTLSNELIEV